MRSSRLAHAALRGSTLRSHARGAHAAAALEHARLREELETVRAKLRRLEADNPALAAEQQTTGAYESECMRLAERVFYRGGRALRVEQRLRQSSGAAARRR